MQRKIHVFFSGVLEEVPELEGRINESSLNIYFRKDCLVFDLTSLYEFIFSSDELSFIEFKKLLYASELNKQLMAEGGKIVLIDNKGNINKSLYGLSRCL